MNWRARESISGPWQSVSSHSWNRSAGFCATTPTNCVSRSPAAALPWNSPRKARMSGLSVNIKGLKSNPRSEISFFNFGIQPNHVTVEGWARAGHSHCRVKPRSSHAPGVNLQRIVCGHPNMLLPLSIGSFSNSHALIPHLYLSETRFAVLLVERLGCATS